MKKTALFFGEVDTRHFTFHIFGKTEAEVRQLMADAWERHSKETGADPDHLQECDINVLEFEVGKVYRDWREISRRTSWGRTIGSSIERRTR